MRCLVCIGECMVELSPMAGGLLQKRFAGDTFNTAWYARKLLGPGWRVFYFTALGDDELSTEILAFMQSSGIEVPHVMRLPGGSPGLYMIHVKNGERQFSYWRSQSAARKLAQDPNRLALSLSQADVVYLSGISLAILDEAGRENLLEALATARADGKVIAYDPNFRARLWPDLSAARPCNAAVARLADIVLTGLDDEKALNGLGSTEDVLRLYQSLGLKHIVVKNGAGLISVFQNDVMTHVEPPAGVTPVDTTAAGDSFNAGYLASWLDGAKACEAANSGARVAAQVVGSPGALVDIQV